MSKSGPAERLATCATLSARCIFGLEIRKRANAGFCQLETGLPNCSKLTVANRLHQLIPLRLAQGYRIISFPDSDMVAEDLDRGALTT